MSPQDGCKCRQKSLCLLAVDFHNSRALLACNLLPRNHCSGESSVTSNVIVKSADHLPPPSSASRQIQPLQPAPVRQNSACLDLLSPAVCVRPTAADWDGTYYGAVDWSCLGVQCLWLVVLGGVVGIYCKLSVLYTSLRRLS